MNRGEAIIWFNIHNADHSIVRQHRPTFINAARDHGLWGSNKLLYKRWTLSMGEGKFWPHISDIYWPIVLKLKLKI